MHRPNEENTNRKLLELNHLNNTYARVFFLKARSKNNAVIFRRGPTDWIQMIIWNLDKDIFELGQWINKKVPMRNCDVSPSGEYLIYYVDNFENGNSRTVISKPPFWSALTAWEHGDSLFDTGGGLYVEEKSILLNLNNIQALEKYPYPIDLNISMFQTQKKYSLWKGHINLLHEHRLKMNGWAEQDDEDFIQKETEHLTARSNSGHWDKSDLKSTEPIIPKLWRKQITNSAALYMITFYHNEHRKNFDLFYLGRKIDKIKLTGIEWADIDNKKRIIATKEGKLYVSKISSDGSVDYANLIMIKDLNSQKPKRIYTPKNMREWNGSC